MVLNSLRFRAYGLGLSGLVRRRLNEAYARDCIPDIEWEKNPPQLFQEPQGYPPASHIRNAHLQENYGVLINLQIEELFGSLSAY